MSKTIDALLKTITLPQVSINGSSKQDLIEQQCEVMKACRALRQALSEAYPNGRDYQHDASKFEAAMSEHRAMQDMVTKVFDRADAIASHLSWEV